MESVIPAPRAELNKYAPRMEVIKIPADKIGALIGKGGETIRGICETTGAQIDIEEEGEIGRVSIYAVTAESMEAAPYVSAISFGAIFLTRLPSAS